MVIMLVLFGMLGAVIGSFLNVVVHRLPAGESVIHPPSSCPACGHRVRWIDNVPVLSWVVLRGRCRDCRAPISIRYPLVEGATTVGFVLIGWWWLSGRGWDSVAVATADFAVLAALYWFLAAGIALAIIDARVHRLPDAIVVPLALVATVLLTVAAALTGDWAALLRAGLGAAALAAFYLALALLVPGGMGFGDVKLAFPIGMLLGWFGIPSLLVGAFAAFILGGSYGLILMVLRQRGRRGRVAFGPWMLLGAWIGITAGDAIGGAYVRMFGMATEGVM